MPPDATDTKRRILEAARAEFAAHGLSGARVERVAVAARANKQSIYAHFGSKDDLFDTVVGQALVALADAAPFDADDLPAYAGALHDRLDDQPDILRLTTWAVLERPQPIDSEVESYRLKIDAIREAQAEGSIPRDHDPVRLLAVVIAIATSWNNASWSLRSLGAADGQAVSPSVVRAGVVAAVEGVVRG